MLLQKQIKVTIILFFIISVILNATNIRGRIDGYNQYYRSYYPLSRVTVDLYFFNQNRWQQVSRYITGNDGMYYFQNLYPGNNYSIQINGRENYPISVYNMPNQDLPLITLSY